MMRNPAVLGLMAILSPLVSAQTFLEVGPTQTYADIQSAVDAANPGDRILVRQGSYNGAGE